MLSDQKIRQMGGGGQPGRQPLGGRSKEEGLDLGHVEFILLHSSGSSAFQFSFLFAFEGRGQC